MSPKLKRSWGKKSVNASALIFLLILPAFPERTTCNVQHFYRQQRATSYYSSYKGGASRDEAKSYLRRTQPTVAAYQNSEITAQNMAPPKSLKYLPSPPPRLSSGQNPTAPHGLVFIQRVPSLPPQLLKQPFSKTRPLGQQNVFPRPQRKQFINYPVAMKEKCDGRKNIIDDIGLFSLVTAVMSSSFGLYTVLVNSVTSNNIGLVSGFLSLVLWVPSTLLALFNPSGNYVYLLGNFLNSASFINSMYGFMGVVFGTADVLASTVGETVGIISFILSVVATFPDYLDAVLNYLIRYGGGKKMEYFVENYGCSVPSIFNYFGKSLHHRISEFLVHTLETKENVLNGQGHLI